MPPPSESLPTMSHPTNGDAAGGTAPLESAQDPASLRPSTLAAASSSSFFSSVPVVADPVDAVIEKLLSVRGTRPGKQVGVAGACLSSCGAASLTSHQRALTSHQLAPASTSPGGPVGNRDQDALCPIPGSADISADAAGAGSAHQNLWGRARPILRPAAAL
mmetsp:Transcript_30467/g.69766  ORF Transcript_30467/g.69766 Transcript_30467/m.69766 type:complete len:162 (-) Transcript_30467:975-1460(-)